MRRMWMLLLVVTLMVIALAVPAMAAHNHDDGTWEPLTDSTTPADGGHYYLTGALTMNLTIKDITVTICLNGQTWNGNGGRPLTLKGTANVTVCDCQYTSPENPGNGKIQGYQFASGGIGGAVSVEAGAFTLQSGTITGGKAANGGNIYNKGTLTITGGVISGGEATNGSGGNIWSGSTTTTVEISGGLITSGVSTSNGGNIISGSTSTLNLSGDAVITLGQSGGHGGNIACQGVTNLNGGRVSNGIAPSNMGGDNVYISNANGKLVTMQGVTIEDDNVTSSCSVYFNATNVSSRVNIYAGTEITGAGKPTVYVNAANTSIVFNVKGATLNGKPMRLACGSGKSLTAKIEGTSTISGEPTKEGSGKITFYYNGVLLDNSWNTVYTLADAVKAAIAKEQSSTDGYKASRCYIKVLENTDKKYKNQTIPNSTFYLDLNGMGLENVTFAGTSRVKLIDSTANSYSAGTGWLTVKDGGTAAIYTDCVTDHLKNNGTYDHAYRYVSVLKDGKYTAHRIYMAVKAIVLVPSVGGTGDPMVKYRTTLRCDDTVAALVNNGEYGVGFECGANTVTAGHKQIDGYTIQGGGAENTIRLGIDNILSKDGDDNLAAGNVVFKNCNAYIKFTDDRGEVTIESAKKDTTGRSLKDLVEAAAAINPNAIGDAIKTALGQFYNSWKDILGDKWNISSLAQYYKQ